VFVFPFPPQGEDASYPYYIPRLRVKRDWYKGLNPDPVDHSHPDVGAGGDDSGLGERAAGGAAGGAGAGKAAAGATPGKGSGSDSGAGATPQPRQLTQRDRAGNATAGNATAGAAAAAGDAAGAAGRRRRLMTAGEVQGVEEAEELSDEAEASFKELFADQEGEAAAAAAGDEDEDDGWLDDADAQAFRDFGDYSGDEAQHTAPDGGGDPGDGGGAVGGDVRAVRDGHRGQQERPAGLDEDHPTRPPAPPRHTAPGEGGPASFFDGADYAGEGGGDYRARRGMWDDELDAAPDHSGDELASPYVWIDAHVLATPSIADLDGDGREELVVAVSYFFDPGAYAADSGRAAAAVGSGGDVANYVASGVVVYDLHTRGVKWSQHLDLSTARTRYVAHAYAPPTLADVDGDGRLEVIVGTSTGFLYVLDAAAGAALEGWPVQMGDITGQPAVGDLDGDGRLEVVAGDGRGSVAAFRGSGQELWERHLGGAVGAGPTLADVDGDGRLEVVVGAADGRMHVLDGATGADRPGFPFRAYGRFSAPVLATKLDDPKRPGLQLAAVAGDGVLYVVDGRTGCADSLDLGEASAAMVLADDLAGSGRLDLLVTTVGGTLYAVRTAAAFHPLKAWPAQAPGAGAAGCTARWGWQGVHATRESRLPRDVRGDAVPVRFAVVDRRPALPGGARRGPYKVSVTLQGVGAKDLNAGDQPVIGMVDTVNATGTYTLEVPCPRARTTATIRVEMVDETGAVFSDTFSLSFHVHFYRMLKWLVVGPFAFTAAALLTWSGAPLLGAELPS
jgi:hypothetical protein